MSTTTTGPSYTLVRRTWRERLFSLPWRPWQGTRRVPVDASALFDALHPQIRAAMEADRLARLAAARRIARDREYFMPKDAAPLFAPLDRAPSVPPAPRPSQVPPVRNPHRPPMYAPSRQDDTLRPHVIGEPFIPAPSPWLAPQRYSQAEVFPITEAPAPFASNDSAAGAND